MKKLSGIICDLCNVLIRSTKNMTSEDWTKLESTDITICQTCEAPIRLSELELSKDYINSDYYWSRKKELELIISNS
jgi:hypothetical protein